MSEQKVEEAWRPWEPPRVVVLPAPKKRLVTGWVAEVEHKGIAGPFPTAEAAETWVREWTTKARAMVMPLFCPMGLQGHIGSAFVKRGFAFPEMSDPGAETVSEVKEDETE